MSDHISMRFPADTEYISAIRLAMSGLAGKMDYNLDEIEDLKSCVAEACLLLLCGQNCSALDIDIDIEPGKTIKVNVRGMEAKAAPCGEEYCADFNEEISRLMIGALSEGVVFNESGGILDSIAFSKSPSQKD